MSRFLIVITIFPVLMFVCFLTLMVDYQRQSNQEFVQLRLNHAMNHANDAAMATFQRENTINPEAAEGAMEVLGTANPYSGWHIYKKVLLNNFNMAGNTADQYIERCTPAVMLVTNNGYYVKQPAYNYVKRDGISGTGEVFKYDPSLDLDTPKAYMWSRKIPFAHLLDGDNNKIILDTINGHNMFEVDYTGLTSTDETPKLKTINNTGHDINIINKQLITTMSSMINQSKDRFHTNEFFIPKAVDNEINYRTDTFKGYSLMVAVQDFDPYSLGKSSTNFSVSNTQLVTARKVWCYEDGSKKLYRVEGSGRIEPDNVVEIVTSIYDAARRGYSPDGSEFS